MNLNRITQIQPKSTKSSQNQKPGIIIKLLPRRSESFPKSPKILPKSPSSHTHQGLTKSTRSDKNHPDPTKIKTILSKSPKSNQNHSNLTRIINILSTSQKPLQNHKSHTKHHQNPTGITKNTRTRVATSRPESATCYQHQTKSNQNHQNPTKTISIHP